MSDRSRNDDFSVKEICSFIGHGWATMLKGSSVNEGRLCGLVMNTTVLGSSSSALGTAPHLKHPVQLKVLCMSQERIYPHAKRRSAIERCRSLARYPRLHVSHDNGRQKYLRVRAGVDKTSLPRHPVLHTPWKSGVLGRVGSLAVV